MVIYFLKKVIKILIKITAENRKITIVVSKNIVDVEKFDPNYVHISGIYVNYIFECKKKISKKYNKEYKSSVISVKKYKIPQRNNNLVNNRDVLNLGIGIITLIASFINKDIKFTIHWVNRILGAVDILIKV